MDRVASFQRAWVLPSSSLLADEPEEPAEVKLAAWKTPALVLTSEQAVGVLLAVMDRTTCGPGIVVGRTLAYWSSVLRFAGALVARQQYLPGLDVQANGDGARLGGSRCWSARIASRPSGSRS